MLCCPPVLLSAMCLCFTLCVSATGEECAQRCDLYHGNCDEDGVCRCDPGWEGQFCEACVRMPGCLHGVCHQPWQCMCRQGWAGKFCDKDLHICEESNPCENGGECSVDSEGDYSCHCPEPFHGKNCELKRGPCERYRLPCLNGGTCQDEGGFAATFSCRCLVGYVGRRCEVDVDDCLMRPCANGATCVDGVNRFSCLCPPGFQGRFCTVNEDDCAGRPCHNGGRCLDRVGDYECFCLPGYSGKSCEISSLRPTQRPEPTATLQTVSKRSPAATGNPGHFKISVKEVVTQREAGLSQVQLILLALFGAVTCLTLLTTAGLLLWFRHRSCRPTSEDCKTEYQPSRTNAWEPGKTTEL